MMSFTPIDYSFCLEEPAFLSDVTSWHEHIPFAFSLIQMLQPRLFVELGTHKGDSYLAFCQAVDALGLSTVCCAVDSWEGDPQAGFYGEEIYQKLKEYHDSRYGGFSSLRKCYFDDALPHFEDKSIDLLHIDGLHTYEAVKHDFETWLPKVSDRGVVLFHDTTVTTGDFGVWRFFEEVSSKYPAFGFKHCNGLGMIAVGSAAPESLQPFFDKEQHTLRTIQRFYHAMGTRISLRHTVGRLESKVAELEREAVRLGGDLSACHQQLQVVQRENEQSLADQEQLFLNSLSWKVTAPLRAIYDFLPKGSKRAPASVVARPLKLSIFPTDRKPEEPISLPAFDNPKVSIIIPVYNQVDYTLSCLASIAANTDGIEYEVIIADDASTDETLSINDWVRNVIHIRNADNLGFLRNCNHAAQSARGKYFLFLNNDTNVQPGWLPPLLTMMESDPNIGIAGSKLLYADGKLQEAGGIIWSDASGWNFGWRDDPEKPEYNYVKEVDYISGASIMVNRDLWKATGGFDDAYAPAYFEDTDLAFRARRLGYRVVYQPLSTVVHFEGVSHGKDITKGLKAYQETNRSTFLKRWQHVLNQEHFSNGQNVFLARDRSSHRNVVLVIDHYVPMFDKDAGSFFMYSMIRALVALNYKVVFWPDNLSAHQPYTSVLQQMGVEVILGPHNLADYLKEFGRFFNAAILTRNHVSIKYIDTVRRHIPKVLYHDPDLEFLRESRRIEKEGGNYHDLAMIKEREFYLFSNCEIIGIHSPVERDIILKEFPDADVEVIPLPIQDRAPSPTPFNKRSGLLFVGGTHPPNIDALHYFIGQILPLLRGEIQDITLTVAGEVSRNALKGLDLECVKFTGYVQDLAPLFDEALVYVAPLRFGAGIKGKIIEAANFGLPVITTSIGAEGIGLVDGKDILVADNAQHFSDAVLRLYRSPDLWERLRDNGRQYVESNFSQSAFRAKVEEVMNKLL